MKFAELLAATKPVEFCLRYSGNDDVNVWATSHPKMNKADGVYFYVENGGWWGYLFEDGRIEDDEKDPFLIADPGIAELCDRVPHSAGTFHPFTDWHHYEIDDVGEYLEDEIPF